MSKGHVCLGLYKIYADSDTHWTNYTPIVTSIWQIYADGDTH